MENIYISKMKILFFREKKTHRLYFNNVLNIKSLEKRIESI